MAPDRQLDETTAWVQAIRARSEAAHEAESRLCAAYAGRVRTYALRHLARRSAVDDFVQRVLLALVLALREGRLQDETRIGRFVLGICRNTRYELGRDETRQRALGERVAREAAPAIELPVDRTDLPKLSICLGNLPPQSREVILLAFRDGLDATEIGARLSLAPGNVRVIRHRSMSSLRDCLHAPEAS